VNFSISAYDCRVLGTASLAAVAARGSISSSSSSSSHATAALAADDWSACQSGLRRRQKRLQAIVCDALAKK